MKNKIEFRRTIPTRKKPRKKSRSIMAGEDMEIGFNVNYLLDALAAVDDE